MSLGENTFLQKENEKILKEATSKEHLKHATLYFEFSNTEERDRAMSYIKNLRETNKDFDENFRYYWDCTTDKNRPEAGIEIKFNANPKNIREIFEKILSEGGFKPKEEYETLDGEPVPEETRINN